MVCIAMAPADPFTSVPRWAVAGRSGNSRPEQSSSPRRKWRCGEPRRSKLRSGWGRILTARRPFRWENSLPRSKQDGCPRLDGSARSGSTLEKELYRLKKLEPFWKDRPCRRYPRSHLANYHSWRKKDLRQGSHGGRSVDREISTLSNVLGYATRCGRLETNPLAGAKPKFASNQVRHCRETMPTNADALHTLAENLFEDPRSEALGWQLLLQAMSGCRTNEVLSLRWDAKPRQPGYQEGEWLRVHRAKGGTNPFVLIHPSLRQCLDRLRVWHLDRHPQNPFYIPGFASARRHVQPGSRAQEALPFARGLLSLHTGCAPIM